jgi:hypothetical protein
MIRVPSPGTPRDHAKPEQAHEPLAPIYGWLTDGFKTADLQDTEVLLGDLGGRQVA